MLTHHAMTEDEKYVIADWRYSGDYALYNTRPYEEDRKKGVGFANPGFIGFSFYDRDALIGFTCLYEEDREIMIGIGVAPEYCGRGYGREMLETTCGLSETMFPGKPLYLEVRTWNARAVRCYEKAGFVIDGEPFTQRTGLGEGTFYRMMLNKY